MNEQASERVNRQESESTNVGPYVKCVQIKWEKNYNLIQRSEERFLLHLNLYCRSIMHFFLSFACSISRGCFFFIFAVHVCFSLVAYLHVSCTGTLSMGNINRIEAAAAAWQWRYWKCAWHCNYSVWHVVFCPLYFANFFSLPLLVPPPLLLNYWRERARARACLYVFMCVTFICVCLSNICFCSFSVPFVGFFSLSLFRPLGNFSMKLNKGSVCVCGSNLDKQHNSNRTARHSNNSRFEMYIKCVADNQ